MSAVCCDVPRAHVMQASKETVREADKLKAAAARALLARYGACRVLSALMLNQRMACRVG